MENENIRKMIRFFKNFVIFLIFSCISFNLFCQNKNTPEPYKEDEFSQELQDLRRFEIITLGSMPFVTLDASIVYNGYKFATHKVDKFNPLATTNYSQREMKNIIITSLCVSTAIGISDFVIRFIKRNKTQKKIAQLNNNIIISQIENDPDAIRITVPTENSSELSTQEEE